MSNCRLIISLSSDISYDRLRDGLNNVLFNLLKDYDSVQIIVSAKSDVNKLCERYSFETGYDLRYFISTPEYYGTLTDFGVELEMLNFVRESDYFALVSFLDTNARQSNTILSIADKLNVSLDTYYF